METLELLAQGPSIDQRASVALGPEPITIGRGDDADLHVVWDRFVGRRHALAAYKHGKLRVTLLDAANPAFFHGQPVEQFAVRPGDFFVIGRTRFLVALAESPDSVPEFEQTFSIEELHRVEFNHAAARMEVLSRLPAAIANANDESDLCQRIAAMVLAGISDAEAAAVVRLDGDGVPRRISQWETRRLAGDYPISKRLVLESARLDQSTLHSSVDPELSTLDDMTVADEKRWTLCTPIRAKSCRNWRLYVVGKSRSETDAAFDLRGDVKFTELVAEIFGSLRDVASLQQRETIYHQFFSDRVVDALGDQDPEKALAARQTDAVVLFCDLRGFSKLVEREEANGTPMEAFRIVEKMLGMATGPILEHDGVIGDFQGDAVMAFWGWPEPQPDMVERACRAALDIRAAVRRNREQSDLDAGRHCDMGIGLAMGKAVAGKIGTTDQMKISVFGGVVNLASRLEGMTKIFDAPVIVDETILQWLTDRGPADWRRTRTLGSFIPFGMQHPITVAELLPSVAESPEITDEHIALFEAAVAEFAAGNWEQSLECFDQVPARTHRAKDYFVDVILRNRRSPPPSFSGVIQLDSKT